ncbi:hypothetical protein WJX73_008602 [Symbiochloris irregularis]|uniref:Uncharacterized protein n=1 Tax=Symbiochloris irregularis TaxID=706552 RepID=A0AAW1PWM1_9CHLO
MRVNKGLLASAFLCMVISALAELSIPHFTSACIFAAAGKQAPESFYSLLRILVAVSLSYGIFAGLRGFCFSLLNTTLIQNLRAELFRSMIAREVAFFDSAEVGVLTSRLGSDCQAVVRCLSSNINVAARNSLQCIGGAIYLTWLSRDLALACLVMTTVLWGVALRHGAFTRRAQRAYMNKLADTNQVAQEVFLLSRVVRTFGTEEREVGRYKLQLRTLRRISVRQATAYLLYLASNGSLFHLTKVMALAMGGGMALAGKVTGQQLTAFVLYVEFVMAASLSVCDQWGGVMEAIGASERVIDYLDAPPAPQLDSGKVLETFSGRVQMRDVEYTYPTRPDDPALRGISITLEPGKLLALVGLSGSGKSTLVAMLQRLYDPTRGQVLVDGTDLREVDAAWFRSQIGVVDQEPRLFAESIAANIAYGMEDVSQEQIEEAARLANADKFIWSLPEGFDTKVTDKLLSGGQRQRIALARALVRQPKLLVLDEATSALDAESEAAVAAALDTAMRTSGRSVLVIAHRLSTVRNADWIVVMQKGQVEEEGTHEDLVLGNGIYSQLVNRQQGDGNALQPQRMTLASGFESFDEDDHPSRQRPFEDDEEEDQKANVLRGPSLLAVLQEHVGVEGRTS